MYNIYLPYINSAFIWFHFILYRIIDLGIAVMGFIWKLCLWSLVWILEGFRIHSCIMSNAIRLLNLDVVLKVIETTPLMTLLALSCIHDQWISVKYRETTISSQQLTNYFQTLKYSQLYQKVVLLPFQLSIFMFLS